LLLLGAASACDGGSNGSGSGDASPPDAGSGGTDSGGAAVDSGGPIGDAGPGEARSLTVGPFEAARGVERTQCVSLDLGNDAPMFVRAIRTHLTDGSHHMIVYRLDEAPDPTPRFCGSFSHGVGDSIFIAQQRDAEIRYPAGTGLHVEAHQTIGLEMHYINYVSDAPIDISGTVELDLVPIDGSIEEMQLLFTGDIALSIPARSEATSRSFHSVPSGARIFALTSHTHQLGTHATIHRGDSETTPGALLHESTSWAEPPLDLFDPMLELDPGEGLILTCEYYNPGDSDVGFGTGFDDEMCFLWAHFVR
jgi:hypothetical protein